MKCSYYALILKTNDGMFFCEFPDFPEAFFQAETNDEINNEGNFYLKTVCEEYKKCGEEFPCKSFKNEVMEIAKNIQECENEIDKTFEPELRYFSVEI